MDKKRNRGKMDNPENLNSENESLYDKFEEEQTVDSIPLEDLRMEQKEERHQRATKEDSSSAEKYPD